MVGGIDVMMEVWQDNVQGLWGDAEENGLLVDFGINFPDAEQGWYVPRYVIEGDIARNIEPSASDLHSVTDLARYKHIFAEQGGEHGLLMNCPESWACAEVNSRKLLAYGLDTQYFSRNARSGDDLAEYIVTRYAAGKPFLAYYWTPTRILGALDLVRLQEPEYDPQIWFDLVVNEKPDKATAYPPATVIVGGSFVLALEAPELSKFFSAYSTDGDLVGTLLAERHRRNLDMGQTALVFMKRHPERWKHWVPESIAETLATILEAVDAP